MANVIIVKWGILPTYLPYFITFLCTYLPIYLQPTKLLTYIPSYLPTYYNLSTHPPTYLLCRNPNLGLATKARACKRVRQEGDPGGIVYMS
jgi:hypothetical protein